MDIAAAAVKIQLAWRSRLTAGGRIRTSGSCHREWKNDDEAEAEADEAAQATSGYMSASSSSCCGGGIAHCAPAAHLPRRSWTTAALPLNLHTFGDSSGDDASPIGAASPSGQLSVGSSSTDLRMVQQSCAADAAAAVAAMALCYRNDAASESGVSDSDSDDGKGRGGGGWQRFCRPAMLKDSLGSRSQQISGKSASRSLTRRPLEPELLRSLGVDCNRDIMSAHTRLRSEAQLSAVVHASASSCCSSPRADDAVDCGWAGRGLTGGDLASAGHGALRVLRDCLLARIDVCNSDLVTQLVERDDLHMEQDSLLVEIEDLTRRAQDAVKRLSINESQSVRLTASKLRL